MKSESVRHFQKHQQQKNVKFPCVNKFYASFIFYCEFNGGTLLCCYAHFFCSLSIFPAIPNLIQHQFFLHFFIFFHKFSPFFFCCCSQNRIFNSFSLYVSIQIIIIKERAMRESERVRKVCFYNTGKSQNDVKM